MYHSKLDLLIFEHYVKEIQRIFGFSLDEIKTRKKTRHLVAARHLLMYVLRENFGHIFSFGKIGTLIDRDHSTVIHGVNAVKQGLKYKEKIFFPYSEFHHLDIQPIIQKMEKNMFSPKINFEVFKEIIEKLESSQERCRAVNRYGIDLVNFEDELQSVISMLIGSIYGNEGLETFDWWCYEKDWGKRKDLHMTDSEGNLLCETIEDLHEWLEENSKSDYELPRKMTEEERKILLSNLFGQK